MKNTILVPTDFSENALSAVHYACQLATARQYHIYLYHCYTTQSTGTEEGDDETESDADVLKADLLMKDLVDQLRSTYIGIDVDAVCLRGLIDEKLPKEASKDRYNLIVIGTTGASKNKSVFWGSTTSAITAKSPIPVIAIPAGYRYRTPQHAVLLTKFKAEELDTLEEFLKINGPIGRVTLVHVYKETADNDEVNSKLQSWQFTVNEMGLVDQVDVLSDHISKEDTNLDTVAEVVNKLIDQCDPDIVLITKTRRSFFGRLFTRSVSQALTLELKKPAFFDQADS